MDPDTSAPDDGWMYATTHGLFFALLDPSSALDGGLPPEAIVYELLGDPESGPPGIEPGRVRVNLVFVDFLHRVVALHAPRLPDFQVEAYRQQDGWLYVLDARTPTPQGDVPPEDIIGAFEVRRGVLVPGSYQWNGHHQVVSARGLFRLSPELNDALWWELEQLVNDGDERRRVLEEEERRDRPTVLEASELVALYCDTARAAIAGGNDPWTLFQRTKGPGRVEHATFEAPDGRWGWWRHGLDIGYTSPTGVQIDLSFEGGAGWAVFDRGQLGTFITFNHLWTPARSEEIDAACDRLVDEGSLHCIEYQQDEERRHWYALSTRDGDAG